VARVLVVDDDRAIRELLRFALECEGHEVALFRDGVEILAYLAGRPDPSVILMDVMMPRMDGWEVCRRLTADPGLLDTHSLVLMTAAFLKGEVPPPSPATAVLAKPFNLEQLYTVVSTLAVPALIPERDLTLSDEVLLAS
jgi:two-component system, OmpR family, response regulator MprA